MASFKINFASCRGLPAPKALVAALEEFGFAEGEEIGVLHCSAASGAAFGTLVRRTNVAVQKVDEKTREVLTQKIEKATLIPFGAFAEQERLEVYAGSATAIEEVGAFFASGLSLPVSLDALEIDLESAVEKLIKKTQRFQLRSARVSDYAANSYMIGPYGPKFMDTEHGQAFLAEHAAALKSVQVRFATPAGRAGATLTPNACFGYSCDEDDQPVVQQVLRELL